MNKYDETSDGIINAELTEIILDLKSWEFNEVTRMFYHCGVDGNGYYEEAVIDFVNSPADMWPIIIENGISILRQNADEGWCAFRWDNDDVESYSDNPLRAAAIVFLMMQEAK